MRLKGVYKLHSWIDQWKFQQWLQRTNPGLKWWELNGVRLSVSIKDGKRKRLKKKTIKIELEELICTCCKPCWVLRIV